MVDEAFAPPGQEGRALRLSHRSLLDPLFVLLALEDTLDVNRGRVNCVRLEFADLNEMFDFCNSDVRCSRHNRIKVASRLSVYKVALFIAFPRLHKSKVCSQATLQHVHTTVEFPCFLSFGHKSS